MMRRPAIALLALAGLAAAQSGAQSAIGVQAAGRRAKMAKMMRNASAGEQPGGGW